MVQMTYPDGEVLYYGYDSGPGFSKAYGMRNVRISIPT